MLDRIATVFTGKSIAMFQLSSSTRPKNVLANFGVNYVNLHLPLRNEMVLTVWVESDENSPVKSLW